MAPPTRTLAAFASTLSYADIPPAVREATKQYLLDTIGCGIYGSQTPWVKSLNQLILEQGGRPEATLWLDLAHKVRFEIDPEIEQIYLRAFPSRVAIRLRDSRTVEQYVPGPRGSPENPMTLDEVADKFHLLVDPVLGQERAERLATRIAEIDMAENVQRLTALLC